VTKPLLTAERFDAFMVELMPAILERQEKYGAVWPKHCCTDTCEQIMPMLRAKFNGHFDFAYGYFDSPEKAWDCGHTWIMYNKGIVVDPTVGQFIGAPHSRLIPPEDPLFGKYSSGYPEWGGNQWPVNA
jgi:hypothetical protein